VDVNYALAQCGGIASRSELLKVVTRGDLGLAVDDEGGVGRVHDQRCRPPAEGTT
jgi:hypothetical protein